MTWLLDLLTDVAARVFQNKMGSRNLGTLPILLIFLNNSNFFPLAIVIAPNILSLDNFEPQESLTLSQKVVQFLHLLIVNRLKQKYEN
jgi:hypothetical protein